MTQIVNQMINQQYCQYAERMEHKIKQSETT